MVDFKKAAGEKTGKADKPEGKMSNGFQPNQDEIEDWRKELIGDLGAIDTQAEGLMDLNFPTFFFFDPERNTTGRMIPIDEDSNIKAFPLMPGDTRGGRYAGAMRYYSEKFLNDKQVEIQTMEDGSTIKRKFCNVHVFLDKSEKVFGIWGNASIDSQLEPLPSSVKVGLTYHGKVPHPTKAAQTIHKISFMVEKEQFLANLRTKLAVGQRAKLGLAATVDASAQALPPATNAQS